MEKTKQLLPPTVNINNNNNTDSKPTASPLLGSRRTPSTTAAQRRYHHRATLRLLLKERTALAGSVAVDDTMRRWLRTQGAEENSVQGFASATTLHGISQVLQSRTLCGRAFWILVIVLMILLVVGQVFLLVVRYIDNPTVTSVRVVHPKNGLRFPALTLCMMSKFNQTALTEKYPQINHTLAEFATSSFISSSSTALLDISYFTKFEPNTPYRQLLEELDANLQDAINGTLLDFIKETTFTCEEQFPYCWQENGAMFNCCSANTTTRYLIHSGVCYEFRPMDFTPSMPGPVGGFGFVYVYPRQHLLDSAFNTYGGYAIQMYTSPADAMLERSPTLLPIGYHSHVSLTATKNKRVELNFLGTDTCRDPILRYFDNYSYSNCQAECMVDSTLVACNCTGVTTVINIPENQTCSPLEALVCRHHEIKSGKHLANNKSGKSGKRLTQCRNEKCKEQCEYWSYRPNLAVSRAFNPFLEQRQKEYWRLPQTVNGTSTTESVVIAEIYFKDIIYTVIEEKATLTLESFVSNIGGALGLWTGGSVISWIHLIYFCVLKGLRWRRRRRREDRRQMNRLGRRLGSNFDEPLT